MERKKNLWDEITVVILADEISVGCILTEPVHMLGKLFSMHCPIIALSFTLELAISEIVVKW